MRISVQGDSLELPTESEAYTLGVKIEDGILVVNVVADTYFGARQELANTDFILRFVQFQIGNSIISSFLPPDMEWRHCSSLPFGILTLLRFSFQQKSRLQTSPVPCCLQFLSQIEPSNFCLRLGPPISVSD